MTDCKSTVVIPNYNGINYMEACLESLYAGTSKHFQVIVVDNASTDGSLEIVRQKFPQVRLIENTENTGFAKAVNQGIAASTTPYVILLNNDTRVGLTFIHELEKAMDNDEELFSAAAKMISLYDRDKTDDAGDFYCALGWAFAKGKGKHPDLFDRDYDIFAACGGAAIYRRALLAADAIGPFDENHFAYLEDIDIGYRAKLHGYRNRFVANSIVYHAGSATSGSRHNAFKVRLASQNSVYLVYKNMPLFQVLLNLPFLAVGFLIKTLFFLRKGLGGAYVGGLLNGVRLCASAEGRAHKLHFEGKRIRYYIAVQLSLWRNLLRLAR